MLTVAYLFFLKNQKDLYFSFSLRFMVSVSLFAFCFKTLFWKSPTPWGWMWGQQVQATRGFVQGQWYWMEKKEGLNERMGKEVGNGLADALETAPSTVYKEPNAHFYIVMKCGLQTRNSRNGTHSYWWDSLLFNMLNALIQLPHGFRMLKFMIFIFLWEKLKQTIVKL